MSRAIANLIKTVNENNGIGDKNNLARIVVSEFDLTQDRSVYYCDDYAIRFSSSTSLSFANTVLSLSALQKFDDRPFIVCLITPSQNHLLLANTTFLKKVSHSSQELRVNNIRGSFNGSDIVKEFEGIENCAESITRLYAIHAEIGFNGNLSRLVDATNSITPTGCKYVVSNDAKVTILEAPLRAVNFMTHDDFAVLKSELDSKVVKYKTEILVAGLIENVNIRGRIIEYLIAGEDESLRQELILALQDRDMCIPHFKTENTLGDFHRTFELFNTETDIKTKIMILSSNPKAYNIDKILKFLSEDKSVFMFYFIGINPGEIINTVLVSMFQKDLLQSTILLRHWAGRNSRGVTQFEGSTINNLIYNENTEIDIESAIVFLKRIMAQ